MVGTWAAPAGGGGGGWSTKHHPGWVPATTAPRVRMRGGERDRDDLGLVADRSDEERDVGRDEDAGAVWPQRSSVVTIRESGPGPWGGAGGRGGGRVRRRGLGHPLLGSIA